MMGVTLWQNIQKSRKFRISGTFLRNGDELGKAIMSRYSAIVKTILRGGDDRDAISARDDPDGIHLR
jgi:hypothetical protein